ncbi:MAG: GNAT family N-acetyltransferase [Flavobacteriales bacterium]|nr:GNAT family N-acetyltransferase [Flavobacteriales bacterium]MCB9194348.1 GNAT family N-acetyltransferase [Flavobacteriales bacterium]
MVRWEVLPFSAIDTRLFHDILRLRIDVFVVEQDCPYPELDGLDPDAMHVIGRSPKGAVIAYARILPAGEHDRPAIGRVVVDQVDRGNGVGRRLMEQCLHAVQELHGSRRSRLAAQAHLRKFYERLGYMATGPEYPLDGIPHIDMELNG